MHLRASEACAEPPGDDCAKAHAGGGEEGTSVLVEVVWPVACRGRRAGFDCTTRAGTRGGRLRVTTHELIQNPRELVQLIVPLEVANHVDGTRCLRFVLAWKI